VGDVSEMKCLGWNAWYKDEDDGVFEEMVGYISERCWGRGWWWWWWCTCGRDGGRGGEWDEGMSDDGRDGEDDDGDGDSGDGDGG
jgi:hypothetical protein